MNLSNLVVCELLQYASNNNYCVELRPCSAVIDGFHGESVTISVNEVVAARESNFSHCTIVYIQKSNNEKGKFISPEQFKRMFAKR
ncbi:hypothetical protein AH814_22260 [Salmonella enterica subsp. enterica serovar Rubislaw]|nr:hypothetical protein [Salmonella enterica subsp. enterica serovar Rubislaw]